MLQIKVLTESSIFSGSEIVGQNSQSVYVIESVTLADQILQGHRDAAEAAAAAAYQSEINAANSAAAAAASELQTDEDRRAVENDKLLTAGYRDEAAASAAAADTSEVNAKTSETNAATSASNAAASATSASGSASTATQKATEAATSASAAAADADRSQVAADEATQMLDDFRNVSSVSGNLAVGGTISEAGVNLGNKYAEIAYVDQSIADLIGGAPETLDTLEEIAAILAENDSAMDSMLALIDTKLAKDGSTPMTGNLLMGNKNINGVGGIVFNDETTSNSEGIRWPTSAATPTVYDGIHAAGGYLYFNDTKKVYHQGFKPTPADIDAVNKAGDTMTGALTAPVVKAALEHSSGYLIYRPYGPSYGTGHIEGYYREHNNGDPTTGWLGLNFYHEDSENAQTGKQIDIMLNNKFVYHEGRKPQPAEIGAVNKAGDTMTGKLTTPNLTTDTVTFGAATIVKTDEGISFNV
ncbi:hypothetical protein ACET9H_16925 [Aeromonas media]|uniref:hypothetical protein n=1 Tax=Aeromonas media TaxID=651 RepID=UPI0038CF8326